MTKNEIKNLNKIENDRDKRIRKAREIFGDRNLSKEEQKKFEKIMNSNHQDEMTTMYEIENKFPNISKEFIAEQLDNSGYMQSIGNELYPKKPYSDYYLVPDFQNGKLKGINVVLVVSQEVEKDLQNKLETLEISNQEVTKEKYFVSKEGLQTSLYRVEDVELAKNRYGIKPSEILSLDEEQISQIIYKADIAGKRCAFGTLLNLESEVVAEKRLDSNIRELTVDTEIENTLKEFSKMTYEDREIIAEEKGAADYETCSIYSSITEYAEKKKISTVTVRSVYLLTRAVGDSTNTINLLRNLRRVGIHIYFKNDGLWTGKPIHDMDIGALSVLSMCDDIFEDRLGEIKITNTLF